MIPVVLGWVYVGTQDSAGAIEEAIVTTTVPSLFPGAVYSRRCVGIRDRTVSYESCPKRPSVSHDWRSVFDVCDILEQQPIKLSEPNQKSSLISSIFLRISIAGDDIKPGSIFNYARCWSHMNAVEHVDRAFMKLMKKQENKIPVNGRSWNENRALWKQNLDGSPLKMSRYISAHGHEEPNLSVHAPASPGLVHNCVLAALVALLVQWGSTGAAILIAYR